MSGGKTHVTTGPSSGVRPDSPYLARLAATLALRVHGAGHVLVGGKVCKSGSPCRLSLPAGSLVELRAVPRRGWYLAGWVGTTCKRNTVCRLNLDRAELSVTARFAQIPKCRKGQRSTPARPCRK